MHFALNLPLLNAARQRIRATLAFSVLPVEIRGCEMKLFKVSGAILYISWGCTARSCTGSRCSIKMGLHRGSKTDTTQSQKPNCQISQRCISALPLQLRTLSDLGMLKKESTSQSKTLSSRLRLILNRHTSINGATNHRLCSSISFVDSEQEKKNNQKKKSVSLAWYQN